MLDGVAQVRLSKSASELGNVVFELLGLDSGDVGDPIQSASLKGFGNALLVFPVVHVTSSLRQKKPLGPSS